MKQCKRQRMGRIKENHKINILSVPNTGGRWRLLPISEILKNIHHRQPKRWPDIRQGAAIALSKTYEKGGEYSSCLRISGYRWK